MDTHNNLFELVAGVHALHCEDHNAPISLELPLKSNNSRNWLYEDDNGSPIGHLIIEVPWAGREGRGTFVQTHLVTYDRNGEPMARPLLFRQDNVDLCLRVADKWLRAYGFEIPENWVDLIEEVDDTDEE